MKRLITGAIILTAMMVCGFVFAGDMAPPAGPGDATSVMFTIDDIYNRLNDGTTGVKGTSFTEPAGGPPVSGSGTGHTLDEVMGKAPVKDDTNGAAVTDVESGKSFWGLTSGAWGLQTGTSSGGGGSTYNAGVEKSGQTTCYDAGGTVIDCVDTGQDGDHLAGMAWPDPRFTDNSDGTVTDDLTGLIWLKNANCFGEKDWTTALSDANGLASGTCDLTDSSSAGDWRLPNRKELLSLIDLGKTGPALPTGHPFSGVQQAGGYWSSTTYANDTAYAWNVFLEFGRVDYGYKIALIYVWPVRGGQ